MTIESAIYLAWLGIPVVALLLALFNSMRNLSNSGATRARKRHSFSSFIFLSICSALCFVVDKAASSFGINELLAGVVPSSVIKLLILPLVFLIVIKLYPGQHEQSIKYRNQR